MSKTLWSVPLLHPVVLPSFRPPQRVLKGLIQSTEPLAKLHIAATFTF